MFKLLAECRFRETEFGNPVTEHTAGFGHALENSGPVTEPAQIIRGGESGRTRADDCDFLIFELRKFFHVFFIIKICGKTLEIVDRDRFGGHVLAAVLFAEARADTPDGHGEGNALFDDLKRFFEVSLASGADIFLHAGVCGTCHGTGGFAVAGVLGKKQSERGSAHVPDFVRRCIDLLSFDRTGGAGRQEASRFLVFDDTDETCGCAGYPAVEAEGRDLDPVFRCDGENRFSGRGSHRFSVQYEIDISHFR